MGAANSFTVAIAGATPLQPRVARGEPGEVPIWPGIEVQMLVTRLAERILAAGWRIAFPLRSPFAGLIEPICRNRQRFRAPDDPAAVVWYRNGELELIDSGDQALSVEEIEQNTIYAEENRAQLEKYSITIHLNSRDSARDSLLGLADLPPGGPPCDAIVYIGGRPDEISAGGEVARDIGMRRFDEFIREFNDARGQRPVFLVGACGGFSRSVYREYEHIDDFLGDSNRLAGIDNRSLGEGLVNRGTSKKPRVVPATMWDVSRLVFCGLEGLSRAHRRAIFE